MKEAAIRKKVLEELIDQNWTCWYPAHVKWKSENDIFSIADVIAWRDADIKLIQLTTLPNMSARRKKIAAFFKANPNCAISSTLMVEIWGYDKKKRAFKIEECKP